MGKSAGADLLIGTSRGLMSLDKQTELSCVQHVHHVSCKQDISNT